MSLPRLLTAASFLFALPLACTSTVDPAGPDDPLCDEWNDQAPLNTVTVRIRNETASPLFLGSSQQGCNGAIDLFAEDADGNGLSWRGGTGACIGTCESLREGYTACTDECAVAPTILVEPGGMWEETWSGNVFAQEEMHDACYFEAQAAQPSCARHVVAPSGAYTFRALAWSDTPNCLDAACMCEPDTTGSCTMVDSWEPLTGTPTEATGSLSYPGEDVVEVIFN
jgi:hypothetical protein